MMFITMQYLGSRLWCNIPGPAAPEFKCNNVFCLGFKALGYEHMRDRLQLYVEGTKELSDSKK